jgi:hypothetical protein
MKLGDIEIHSWHIIIIDMVTHAETFVGYLIGRGRIIIQFLICKLSLVFLHWLHIICRRPPQAWMPNFLQACTPLIYAMEN